MRIFQSIYATYRDRGLNALASAIGHAILAVVWQHIFKKRFLKKRVHGYRMLLDLSDKGLSRSLLLFGTREVDHKILLEKIIDSDMNIFDVGANIGYYPLMELELLGPKGKLLAIEPFPQNIELLNRNLKLNGYSENIPIIEGAVSDASSIKQFHISSHSNLGTFHPEGSGSGLITGHTINVKTYTIPELALIHGQPDLIRMDVEGHEVEVINGMIEAIHAGIMQPKIIFETHLSRYSKNHSMENTLTRLFDCDYCVPYAATSWQKGTEILRNMGYPIGKSIKTDGVERVIIENITAPDAIQLICNTGGLRTVVLAPKPTQ